MKKIPKKMSLNRETLRLLDARNLAGLPEAAILTRRPR